MDGKHIATYALTLGLGFGLGWSVRPDSIDVADQINVAPKADGKQGNPLKTGMPQLVSDVNKAELGPVLQTTVAASEETDKETTASQDFSQWSVEDVLAYLESAEDSLYYGQGGALNYLIGHPQLVIELVDRYLDISNPAAKQRALELFTILNRSNDYAIERQIIEKLNLGDRSAEWLSVLSKTGVYTSDSIDALNDQLTYFLDGQEVVNAISAVNKGTMQFFNKIPRQTREAFTQQIANHLQSSDPAIRSAALQSLAGFPVPGSGKVLVDALADTNTLVRRSAIQSLMRGEFQSRSVSDALIAIMKDTSRPYETRVMTTRALRRYNLEGQDYDDLYNFNLEIQNTVNKQRAEYQNSQSELEKSNL